MSSAFAVFSEIWARNESSTLLAESLSASAAAACATNTGRVGWLIHRDLKAADHLLSYELFGDAMSCSQRSRATTLATADVRVTCEVAPLQVPHRQVLAQDNPVAIFVYCRIEEMAAFAPSMTLHVETTLANEPGCLAFAWHRDVANDSAVVLYELYASREALAEHRRSAHLAAFRKRSEHLMLNARIHYAELLPGSPMATLMTFFGGKV